MQEGGQSPKRGGGLGSRRDNARVAQDAVKRPVVLYDLAQFLLGRQYVIEVEAVVVAVELRGGAQRVSRPHRGRGRETQTPARPPPTAEERRRAGKAKASHLGLRKVGRVDRPVALEVRPASLDKLKLVLGLEKAAYGRRLHAEDLRTRHLSAVPPSSLCVGLRPWLASLDRRRESEAKAAAECLPRCWSPCRASKEPSWLRFAVFVRRATRLQTWAKMGKTERVD